MKKSLCVLLSLVFVFAIMFGCSEGKKATSETSVSDTSNNDNPVWPEPNSTITLLIPWAAGNSCDTFGRIIMPYLEKVLPNKPTIVLENVEGASGTVGMTQLVNGEKDGYTITITLPTPILYQPQYGVVSYTIEDLYGVCRVANSPMFCNVAKSSPYQTAEEFIQAIKDNPGQLSYSQGGTGGIADLAMHAFVSAAGLDMISVPFSGGAEVYAQCLGGAVNCFIANESAVAAYEDARPIINLGSKSSLDKNKNLPTIEELGYGKIATDTFTGVYLPAGTPQYICDIWENAIKTVLEMPEVQAELSAASYGVDYLGSKEFNDYLKTNYSVVNKSMKELGLIK